MMNISFVYLANDLIVASESNQCNTLFLAEISGHVVWNSQQSVCLNSLGSPSKDEKVLINDYN